MDVGVREAEMFWRNQAQIDARNNIELRYQQGNGPCNVFIVDTSKSMGDEGFNQMKDIFSTIIDEFANHPEEDENVAVIVCGKNTRFQRYYSNQYSEIKCCLDSIEYGGLSPLTGAFLLGLGAIENGASHSIRMCEFKVRPRIILISDGRPTDFHVFSDDEDTSLNETLQARDHLQLIVKHVGRRHPIFCIPIGKNPDVAYLKFLSTCSRGGRVIYPHEAKQFARYTQNLKATALLSFTQNLEGIDRQSIDLLLLSAIPGKIFSVEDKDDIMDIYAKRSFYTMDPRDSDEEDDERDKNYIERDPRLPKIGSRVKRGPDWHWSNQDNNGPGTVIGHSKNAGWLKVEWDSGAKNDYRYGATFFEKDIRYEVVVCCEPRILEDEMIAVGCIVTRGPDWELGDQDGGEGSLGTVYQIKRNGTAFVRWSNGYNTNHRFGYDGKFDIMICDPFSPEVISFLQANSDIARASARTSSTSEPHHSGFFKAIDGAGIGGNDDIIEQEKRTHNSLCLKLPKGKYFKNERASGDSSPSDVEADGPKLVTYIAENQWLWRDCNGKWKPYPRKINDRINKCFNRNPHSTVVVVINEQNYRVVMAKNTQINLDTRETQEVKLVKTK